MGKPSKFSDTSSPSKSSANASRSVIKTLLGSISCLAVVLIFIIPPSSKILFPAFHYVRETGMYPDGLPIRRHYTGHRILDFIFTGLAGFFSAAVDGNDKATHLFCLWFLPQLCGVLIFCYWEAGRAGLNFVRLPTLVSILAQLSTAGVILPLYFLSYVRNMPSLPSTLPNDSVSRARTVLPAVVLGYVVPSAALFLAPAGTSLDTKQIIAAIWQPFPIYIMVFHNLFRKVDSFLRGPTFPADESNAASFWIKCSYYASALLSAVAHLTIVLPSLFTSNPAHSFANVFVPYYMHPYLPIKPLSSDLPAYRLTVRLLFQHDWLTMTMATLVFFAWSNHVTRTTSGAPWATRMVLLTLIGGPGTAVAWAAVEREEKINNHQRAKRS